MRFSKWLLGAAVVLLSSVLVPWAAMAATPPEVDGVFEGVAPEGEGRVLLVFGSYLTNVRYFQLRTAGETPIARLAFAHRSRTLAVLKLPPGQYVGDFRLAWEARTSVGNVRVRLGVAPGAVSESSLSAELAKSLADAETVGGESASLLHDATRLTGTVTASSLTTDLAKSLADAQSVGGESASLLHDAARLTGTVDRARFSAYDDLVGESKVGTSREQVAAGDHDHDLRYALRAELASSSGEHNAVGNPVDWTQLKGVPSFVTKDYAAGTGLTLSGGTISVNFAGSGSATSAARSDHQHAGTYLGLAGGDTVTGTVKLSTSGQAVVASSGSTSAGAGAVDATASKGTAIAGHGDIGVLGDLDSDGRYAVWGHCTYADQVGVYGSAEYAYSIGVYGAAYLGAGVQGRSYAGTGVYGFSESGGTGAYSGYGYGSYYVTGAVGVKAVSRGGYSTALSAEARGAESTALLVNHTGGSGDLAVFRSGGTNCARISLDGTGYFNGGTYNSGADFAESVAVDAPAKAFEPGDVIAIDPASPRRFSLCRTPDSPLVAGVVSTRPAVVGTVHDMATAGRAALADEVRIGIVGIVPTKVCDEGGPIRIGDLLVSASLSGNAKRAPDRPAPGTVIGKALGALDKGRGKVEVLLMQR